MLLKRNTNLTVRTIFGAIAGDIIGSDYEWQPVKTKDFKLFPTTARFTDDTVMTIAVAQWLMDDKSRSMQILADTMRYWGNRYPEAGYGMSFKNWLQNSPTPYNSWGNGSAMRVSAVGLVAKSLDECLQLAELTAKVSHNHPEGIKGAQAVAACMFLTLHTEGSAYEKKQAVKEFITEKLGYDLKRTLDSIRPAYKFDVSCQGSVPESIIAFLESAGYEDAVKNAVSLGGDSDTQGAVAGGIAACVYPIPEFIIKECQKRLTPELLEIAERFNNFCLQQSAQRV